MQYRKIDVIIFVKIMRLIIYLAISTFLLNFSVSYAENEDSLEKIWAYPTKGEVAMEFMGLNNQAVTWGISTELNNNLVIDLSQNTNESNMEAGSTGQHLYWAITKDKNILEQIIQESSWSGSSSPIKLNINWNQIKTADTLYLYISDEELKPYRINCLQNDDWNDCFPSKRDTTFSLSENILKNLPVNTSHRLGISAPSERFDWSFRQ